MNKIDEQTDLQDLLAELKQLEQDLLEATKSEFPDFANAAYFKEIFSEIENNEKTADLLLQEKHESGQE